MAQTRIGQIQILDGTDFPSFATDDLIEAFYDDSTETVIHKKNGSTITSGDPIELYHVSTGKVRIKSIRYQFCDGSNLALFFDSGDQFWWSDFPYFRRRDQLNSPLCTGVICDLSIEGTPIVVNADSGSANGSITISAYSTATTVRFALSDIQFDSMELGTESTDVWTYTFSGLESGLYTIYVKDSQGCKRQIEVLLPVNDFGSYATRYFFSFTNYYVEATCRINIKQKNYTGGASELTHSGEDPVKLSWSNTASMDKLNPVMGSTLTLELVSTTDQEWVGVFRNINEKEYLIELLIGGVTAWRGFTIPYIYSEPFVHIPYTITITATDGIGDLSKERYTALKWDQVERYDNNQKITGISNVLEIILFCLRKTGIIQNIRVAMNTYATSHNSTSSDDPLKQTYLENAIFYDYDDEEPEDCLSILQGIMASLPEPCILYSSNGYWYITPIESTGSSLAYREFDSYGTYQSNSTISPIIDFKTVDQTSRALYEGGDLRFDNIYNKIQVVENRYLAGSLSQKFDRSTLDEETGIFADGELVAAGFAVSCEPRFNIGNPHMFINAPVISKGDAYVRWVYPNQSWDQVMSISLAFTYQIRPIGAGLISIYKVKWAIKAGTRYLKPDGTWTTTETINEYLDRGPFRTIKTVQIEAEMPSLATNQTIELRLYSISMLDTSIDVSVASNIPAEVEAIDIDSFGGSSLPVGYNLFVSKDNGSNSYTTAVYELHVSDATTNSPNILDANGSVRTTGYRWLLLTQGQTISPGSVLDRIAYYGFDLKLEVTDDEVASKKTETYVTATNNALTLSYDLSHFDLDTNVPNGENKILNVWRYSDGFAITDGWGTNAVKSQKLVLDFLGRLYKEPTRIITISGKSDVMIWPYNVMRFPTDDNRLYKWNRFDLSLKYMSFNGEIAEIGSDTPVTLRAFSDGFSNGFS